MNKVLIVCNGEDFNPDKIKSYSEICDFIIAVDGGLIVLHNLLIKPDLIIGDLDSVRPEILTQFETIQKIIYPSEKDFTDSELALIKANELQPKEIIMMGVTGSYPDHSLANLINLFKYHQSEIELTIVTSNSEISPVFSLKYIKDASGRRFSLFPLSFVKGLQMTGSKYQHQNKTDLTIFDYSISNVIIDNELKIVIQEGWLLCILFDEDYQ